MNDVTNEIYENAIPSCCELNFKQHEEMIWCWGLFDSIKNNYKLNCGCCEFNKENKNE